MNEIKAEGYREGVLACADAIRELAKEDRDNLPAYNMLMQLADLIQCIGPDYEEFKAWYKSQKTTSH